MYFNQGINLVQGEAAAKSWYVPAGQTALLMDSEEMMELYEYLHGKHIEDATAVKVMQNTFKGV